MNSSIIHFGGRPDEPKWKPWEEIVWTPEMFGHYICTVWVNEHAVPTEPSHLSSFDVATLWPEYEAYIAAHGKVPQRGASLEEMWLGAQLELGKPIDFVLSTSHPAQPVSRITRLRRLSPPEIWKRLCQIFADPSLERPFGDLPTGFCPLLMAVSDGQMAHFVSASTVWQNCLHFQDPWPTRSLLCEEENRAGVAARESDLIKSGWRITEDEFRRVIVALYVHAYAPGFGRQIAMTADERRAEIENDNMMRAARQMLRKRQPDIASARKPSGMKMMACLRAAAALGRTVMRAARQMLRMRQPDVDWAPNPSGMRTLTRLQAAAALGRMWEVKVGLNEGDDVNAMGGIGTALHAAANNGHLDIVKLLIRYGADSHLKNRDGQTAAESAVQSGETDVAEFLRSVE